MTSSAPPPPGPARGALLHRLGLEKPFILYVGAADPRKNLAGLIQAYARLPEPLRSATTLACAGTIAPIHRAALQAEAARANLPPNAIRFLGYVPDPDLIPLYASCAVFVLPSLHEGFGLPAAEAMACGAPTIGSDTTSIPDVIGRPDALFDAASPDSIAAAITRVLTDPAFANDLRTHGWTRPAASVGRRRRPRPRTPSNPSTAQPAPSPAPPRRSPWSCRPAPTPRPTSAPHHPTRTPARPPYPLRRHLYAIANPEDAETLLPTLRRWPGIVILNGPAPPQIIPLADRLVVSSQSDHDAIRTRHGPRRRQNPHPPHRPTHRDAWRTLIHQAIEETTPRRTLYQALATLQPTGDWPAVAEALARNTVLAPWEERVGEQPRPSAITPPPATPPGPTAA